MTGSTKKRNINIDCLRVFACFLVVTIHVSSQNWHSVNIHSFDWIIYTVFDTAARSAVPLFFMISGSLFLKSNDNFSLRKLLIHNVVRLIIIYFVWDLLYSIDTIGLKRLLNINGFSLILNQMLDPKYHLWYLPRLIGIYLLIPFLSIVVNYKKGSYVPYFLALFFIFSIAFNTLSYIPQLKGILNFISDEISYDLVGYCGYFVLGYYLVQNKNKFKVPSALLIPIFILVVAISSLITINYSFQMGKASTIMMQNLTIAPFIESICLFLVFDRLNFKDNGFVSKIFIFISKYTLFIYLAHIFEQLNVKFGLSTLSFNPLIAILILTALVFVLSLIMGIVLGKALNILCPKARRYIM